MFNKNFRIIKIETKIENIAIDTYKLEEQVKYLFEKREFKMFELRKLYLELDNVKQKHKDKAGAGSNSFGSIYDEELLAEITSDPFSSSSFGSIYDEELLAEITSDPFSSSSFGDSMKCGKVVALNSEINALCDKLKLIEKEICNVEATIEQNRFVMEESRDKIRKLSKTR